MATKWRCVYNIPNLVPRTDGTRDRFEFGISLDREFAQATLNSKLTTELNGRFQALGNEALRAFGIPNEVTPYSFVGDSLLLHSAQVHSSEGKWISSSDAVDMGRDQTYSRDELQYHSHNMDNATHTQAAMALFVRWVEYAKLLVG